MSVRSAAGAGREVGGRVGVTGTCGMDGKPFNRYKRKFDYGLQVIILFSAAINWF